jgi:D-beta-D-heptose 7-phosphate kinase/D-beta-D-heptose 1-phosphate adenosyltransferase
MPPRKKGSKRAATKGAKKKGTRARPKKAPARARPKKDKVTRAPTKAPAAVRKEPDVGGRSADILKAFRKQRILVIGDLMLDRYIWGDVSRISPEAPVPVVKVKGESHGLGGASNVAENIIALGAKAIPLGIVGNDEDGKLLLDQLKERGMDTAHIIKHPTRNTTSKTRVMARNQQMVRVDREETAPISSTLESAVAGYLHSLLDEIDVIIVSDYGKGVVTPNLMRRVTSAAKAKGKMVFVDPKLPNFREYAGCTAITPNHYEAASFVGTVPDQGKRLMGIGKEILKRLGCEVVLITRGKDGMSLFLESGKVHNIPTMASDVFDVTGAGDTVISVFALAVSAGANWLEAARIANHAAGIVIRKVGAATLTQEELAKEMGRR